MNEFKVGDTVVVTNKGNTYSRCSSWAKKYNLHGFEMYSIPVEGSIGKIIVAEPHPSGLRTLYAIDIDGQHYIMNADGILPLCNVGRVAYNMGHVKIINNSLGLEEVSLNLRKEVIEKFKAKAYDDKVSHICLMRKALAEYVGVTTNE